MRADHFAIATELADGRKGEVARTSGRGRCPGAAVQGSAHRAARRGGPRGRDGTRADEGSRVACRARSRRDARTCVGARARRSARAPQSAAGRRAARGGSARFHDVTRRPAYGAGGAAPALRQSIDPAAASRKERATQKDTTRNREERDSSHALGRARSIPPRKALIHASLRVSDCATLSHARPPRQRLRPRPQASSVTRVG